jgi:hypothetical protein
MCRECRAVMKVANSRDLPAACTWCGATTWDEDGLCQAPAGCDAVRRPASRTPGFCHVCGWSIWSPLPPHEPPDGGEAA